jgi:hypothetical protein
VNKVAESIPGQKANVDLRFLRLEMMRPDGNVIHYDELFKADQASYDAAREKLSNKEREKVAEGWDVVTHAIVQSTEQQGEHYLHGKTWELVGEPAVSPARPFVDASPMPANAPANGIQMAPTPLSAAVIHQPPPIAGDADAFLEALGELCMTYKMVITGDYLALKPFSMKAFRQLMNLGE